MARVVSCVIYSTVFFVVGRGVRPAFLRLVVAFVKRPMSTSAKIRPECSSLQFFCGFQQFSGGGITMLCFPSRWLSHHQRTTAQPSDMLRPRSLFRNVCRIALSFTLLTGPFAPSCKFLSFAYQDSAALQFLVWPLRPSDRRFGPISASGGLSVPLPLTPFGQIWLPVLWSSTLFGDCIELREPGVLFFCCSCVFLRISFSASFRGLSFLRMHLDVLVCPGRSARVAGNSTLFCDSPGPEPRREDRLLISRPVQFVSMLCSFYMASSFCAAGRFFHYS